MWRQTSLRIYLPPSPIKEQGKVGLSVAPSPASVLVPTFTFGPCPGNDREPGFRPELRTTISENEEIHNMLKDLNPSCELEVDGGVDPTTAPLVKAAGANVLVAGSAIFGKADRAAAIESIRKA